jgi:hypothetical protein
MKTLLRTLSFATLYGIATLALAQEQPAKPTPQSEAGEPRASTSQPPAGGPGIAAPAPPTTKPAKNAQSEAGEPRASGATPAVRAAKSGTPAGDGSTKARGPGGTDRLDLGTATVTGDREQPKVMYIVPWKRSDIGDLAGKPMNSLVDEILSPVDRDVFKREVVYYKAVQSDATQNGAPARHPSDQGEK